MKPKFRVGQMVRLASGAASSIAAGGAYEVVRVPPISDGAYHYLVKSRSEAHERVVREDQITASRAG